MKTILLCLAIAPLVVSCKFSYDRHSYVSTSTFSSSTGPATTVTEEYHKTIKKRNGHEECSYTYKRNKYGYTVKSNGPLKIKNAVVEKLKNDQIIDLVITEDGQEYGYTICNAPSGVQVSKANTTMTVDDDARVKKALEGVEKQAAK